MAGTGPERACGALAGKNRAIISAHIDAERELVGRDPTAAHAVTAASSDGISPRALALPPQCLALGIRC